MSEVRVYLLDLQKENERLFQNAIWESESGPELQEAVKEQALAQITRVKALVPILVPLFVSAFRRAYELAVAMECRCYRGGEGRTRMKQLHLATRDYLSIVFTLLVIAGVVLRNVFVNITV